jgi:hypothetical protein
LMVAHTWLGLCEDEYYRNAHSGCFESDGS